MPINTNYSNLANIIKTINNPDRPWGTVIEEIPTDIGRSYEGYKRGGMLEGAEKMRKELMTAAVWVAGIPAFNAIGNFVFEKFFHIPTKNIDFSNPLKGNDAILDSAKYIVDGIKKEGLDYSDLEHFVKNSKIDFSDVSAEELAKKITRAKKFSSISAAVLNCVMMGIVIPKYNQYLTNKALKKQQEKVQKTMQNFVSFDEFQKEINSKQKEVSFKGQFKIPTNSNDLTYAIENDNRTRLLITDVPMLIGRMLTSRNKYEALEYLVMDGLSAYFYNFSSEHIQKLLRGKKTPDTQAITIETLTNNPDIFKKGLKAIEENPNILEVPQGERPDVVLKNIFGNDAAREIYKNETYGKYGKANRFIEDDTLSNINESVVNFIKHLKEQAENQGTSLFVDNELNTDFINKTAKKVKSKNAAFLSIGLLISILGLSVIIPKLTFFITKLLTGKNEFTGLADYDEKEKQE